MSKRIKRLQKLKGIQEPDCDITHVAFAVRLKDSTAEILDVKADPNGLYVCETTTLNKWANKKGLQVNPFNEWLKNYNGKVYVRHLDFERELCLDPKLCKWIFSHLRNPEAQKYESGIPGLLELILCEIGIRKSILQTAELHCTEWVAETLQEFGIMAGWIKSNRMPPHIWWSCKMNGCEISEPIRIK